MCEPPVTVDGLKAELRVLHAREGEVLAEAVQLRKAAATAEQVRTLLAEAGRLGVRITELARRIRELQEH